MYISYKSIVKNLNIQKGDIILVSSDILQLAQISLKNEKEFDMNKFIDSLQEAVGSEGTLLFPTYNWSFCKGKTFNYKTTKSRTGSLSAAALKRPDFIRTRHPIYSFAVWGKYKDYLFSLTNTDSFAALSPFGFLHQNNAKELFIDVEYRDSFTFAHYVEESHGNIPYRYMKNFTASYIDENEEESVRTYSMYVRTIELNTENNFTLTMGKQFSDKGCSTTKIINGLPFILLNLAEAYKIVFDDIDKNNSRNLVYYDGQEDNAQGNTAYKLASEIFPICRSITGNGNRKTLNILKREIPEIQITEVPSGTQVFDWVVPKEWNIQDAWIKNPNGEKIIDFKESNLHVMGYSLPVNKKICFRDLLNYIYTEESQPDVIPYVTSYYKERFGFCMTENQKQSLLRTYNDNDEFEIFIDSSLKDGSLTYADVVLPPPLGSQLSPTNKEVLFSTYICHPSLANNECSGPVLAVELIKYLKTLPNRKHTYRFVFIPETIGSITYLSRNYKYLKEHVIAGFNLTCVGDNNNFSYLQSAYGNTLADKVLINVLSYKHKDYKTYPFTLSGSDERRYNAPNIELPVVCFSRSLYGQYPEYHTSADNMDFISAEGLQGSFDTMRDCIQVLEHNAIYKLNCLCEPQLGKRNLYPTVSRKGQYDEVFKMVNLLSYINGKDDLLTISYYIHYPITELMPVLQKLEIEGLIEIVK